MALRRRGTSAAVLRLRARATTFVAFDPAARRRGRRARSCAFDRGAVHAELGETRPARGDGTRLAVTWIQGLAKGEKMDAIVRDATELGATRFVADRDGDLSVVRLEGLRAEARRKRWEKIAEEGARQCGRADAPTIDAPCSWRDALSIARVAPVRFCLFERASAPLGPALSEALASSAAMAFAAGPEGGLAESEVADAMAAGFQVVSLGELILRTETVVSAVLGAVRIFLPGLG
jgi:16S rRNA (uracil1498-N3)-methyltransferase